MNNEDHAYTIEQLPTHRSQVLSQEQRRALAPLVQRPDVPGKGFLTLDIPEGGSFTLYPERMNGDDPMVEVKFRLPFPPGMNLGDVIRDKTELTPEEQARRFQMKMGADLGSIWSQALAVELLSAMRTESFDLLPETQLAEAGFTHRSEMVWEKETKGGFFSFYSKPECGWLTFEKNGATHWHNLLLLNYYAPWQDQVHAHPLFWPDTVSDPKRALAGLAVKATEIWTPDLLPKRGRKRGP